MCIYIYMYISPKNILKPILNQVMCVNLDIYGAYGFWQVFHVNGEKDLHKEPRKNKRYSQQRFPK
jgi:hypothetical protein